MPYNPQGAKWIRRTRRLALYLRDGFHCVYCGAPLLQVEPNVITLDHVDPAEYFGAAIHTNDNLVTACQHCNKSKKSTPLTEWTVSEATVLRVHYHLALPVPNVLAVAIVRQSRATKRLTAWRAAVRKAQAHALLANMAGRVS